LDDSNLVTGVYQYGQAAQFTETYVREVTESHNVRLCHSATVVGFLTASNGRRVVGLSALSRAGASLRVEARLVVLAGGAIENARLLLLARDGGSSRVSDPAGWTGRCFMEHPRDFAMTLFPSSRDFLHEAAFYTPHSAQDGTVICGRIALTEQAIRRARLPNASITLLLGSKLRLPPRSAAGRLVQRLRRASRQQAGGLGGRLIGQLRTLAERASDAEYGGRRIGRPSQRSRASRLLVNLEQRPHVDNRIVLGASRDFLGVPKAVLHWRWRAEEQAELERLRRAVAGWFSAANLGRVEIVTGVAPDPNAHHHAGTTRMHVDPDQGVVDADGRVHGTDNLYVTGASVFPTSGFANPTLTITALSLRLADRLKNRT
jgi:choline dehydrogenase-like flavoprotein